MHECVILLRNPVTHKVLGISNDFGYIAVFANLDEAIAFADLNKLCRAWPYQIVELDEL